RPAYSRRGCPRNTVSINLELQASGQRRDAAADRIGLCQERLQSADHLYARRTSGVEAVNDPIVEEVRRVRDAHAARFNYDLDAIFQDIKQQEKKCGYQFVAGV